MARLSNKVNSIHLISLEGFPRDKKKCWRGKYCSHWRCLGHITAYNQVHIGGLRLYRTQYERHHSFQKMNESQTNVFSVDVNLFLIFLRTPHSIDLTILFFSDTFVHWFFRSELICQNFLCKQEVRLSFAAVSVFLVSILWTLRKLVFTSLF